MLVFPAVEEESRRATRSRWLRSHSETVSMIKGIDCKVLEKKQVKPLVEEEVSVKFVFLFTGYASELGDLVTVFFLYF
jgi:hypothetical protein